jgi:hypothetical protein
MALGASLALGLALQSCMRNVTHPSFLPSSAIPQHYALDLNLPDPNEGGSRLGFTGSVNITVIITSPTSCLVLNVGGSIIISNASIGGVALPNTYISYERQHEMVILYLPTVLSTGTRTDVKLAYSGKVVDATDPVHGGDFAHGLFLSPNTVPPPSSDPAEDSVAAMNQWRLKTRTRDLRRKRRSKHLHSSRLGDMIRSARAAGSPMMLATQFEQSDARGMFPGFDEPAYKATFDARISVPASGQHDVANLTVLFNTAETSSEMSGARRVFNFQRTLHPLPTYLVAVAVGSFDFLEATKGDVRFRIATPPGYKEWARFALNATMHAVDFFERRFGLPYRAMNSKMDTISVAAMDMDAMENQGLLTYSPQMLLLNPDASKHAPAPLGAAGRLGQAQLILLVITHEVLHQWFGDTVTMRDWAQEYLNEGFARMMQSVGADDLVPTWDATCLTGQSQMRSNSFYQFTYEVALTFDMSGAAPAVVYPLPGGGDIPPFPNDIALKEEEESEDPTKAPLFSRIFYEKGATVNRMVAAHLGWDLWDAAIGAHVRKFLWQNPTVEDLMRSLDNAFAARAQTRMGASAMLAMLPWLRRAGFPVVTLELLPGGRELRATQVPVSRYLPSAEAGEPWWVPLQISVNNSAPFRFELANKTATMHVPAALRENVIMAAEVNAEASSVVADPAFVGAFVVRYADPRHWDARIADAGDFTRTPPDYRRNIAFSAFVLVSMSHEPATLFSRIAAAMAQPLSRTPKLGGWDGASDMYSALFARAQPLATVLESAASNNAAIAAVAKQLAKAMADVSGLLVQRLGWADDESLVDMAAAFGGDNVSAEAIPWPVHDDHGMEARTRRALRPIALFQAVQFENQSVIEAALARFRAAVSNGYALPAAVARAAFFAAARYGTDADWNALRKLWVAIGASFERKGDALFALSAGAASDVRCSVGLYAVGTLASPQLRLDALSDVLKFAPRCRASALEKYVVAARELWLEQGSARTTAILSGLKALSTVSELQMAGALFAEQKATVVTADEVHGALTGVRINIDMLEFNSREASDITWRPGSSVFV